MTKRIAIIGGGISGVSAAWQITQLARAGADVDAQLFESSNRFGGIVETVHHQGFTIECGPDAWVTEKPWARDLAGELGLAHELLPSNDATRKTHILLDGSLKTMPDGMRMMVPTDLDALDRSSLFPASAKRAFHDELARASNLKRTAPLEDESVASFTRRHFGEEVLLRVAAPLLSGVLGGDVERLSVQAVMPQFVAMEREHGSLIAALQSRRSRPDLPIFTTLRSGLGTLIDRLVADLPPGSLHRNTPITAISYSPGGWTLHSVQGPIRPIFDAVFLTAPAHVARQLLQPLDPVAADLLRMDASSAIVVALGYTGSAPLPLPPGFGFLVPAGSGNQLLACTFVDQKFESRVPPGGRLLRAFFGGAEADALRDQSDEHLSALAGQELPRILGPLPQPAFTLIRRWPRSLPQYAVGHLTRNAALNDRVAALPGLRLLGNGYRGVGLPDLIRDARSAARSILPC
ncbi:MAG: protoporphyrinogen oxidase [Acidobacteriaceae bacterium]